MGRSVDRLMGFWLNSKEISHTYDISGFWIGEGRFWYLWTCYDILYPCSVFLQRVEHDEELDNIWSDEIAEYDLRIPRTLEKLEKDIKQHLKEEDNDNSN